MLNTILYLSIPGNSDIFQTCIYFQILVHKATKLQTLTPGSCEYHPALITGMLRDSLSLTHVTTLRDGSFLF